MLRANGERLKSTLMTMAQFGATPGGGVTRTALTDEDKAARMQFVAWAEEANLPVRWDDVGNMYARLEGREPDLDPVLIGSHIDSVPGGGRFDGIFGVMTSLEVARTLRDAGVRPRRSLEVVNFTNEEGARFEPSMACSGVLAGAFTPEYVHGLLDKDGRSFGDELERIGFKGTAAARPRKIHAYVETHIEQGPVLEAEGLPLGVVEGIIGLKWINVTLRGVQQHAGPSPMRMRRDAMVAAARCIVAVRDMALEIGDPAVATVGRIKPTPGIINQIPGQVSFSVDVRQWTKEKHDEIGRRAVELLQRIAAEEKVEAEIDEFWTANPVAFDRAMTDLVEEKIQEVGVPYRRLVSGAGHDATYISEIAPTAMLFVRTIGGKSHCETEDVLWEDAQVAADVLLRVVSKLIEA